MIERRAEILRLLLEDLQLEGVELHENFATVKASLATYRVHLGSAAIYVEPGRTQERAWDVFSSAASRA